MDFFGSKLLIASYNQQEPSMYESNSLGLLTVSVTYIILIYPYMLLETNHAKLLCPVVSALETGDV